MGSSCRLDPASTPSSIGDDVKLPSRRADEAPLVRKRRPTGNVGKPTCTNCYVPMTLCHCQKSVCSSCRLPKHSCGCVAKRAPRKCDGCASLESDLATAKAALEAAEGALAVARGEASAAQNKMTAAQVETDKTRREASAAKNKLADAIQRADEAERDASGRAEAAAVARRQHAAVADQLGMAETRGRVSDAARSVAEQRAHAAAVEEKAAREAAQVLREELRAARAAAEEDRAAAEETIRGLRAAVAEQAGGPNWKDQVEEARRMLAAAAVERDRLRLQLAGAAGGAAELDLLRAELDLLRPDLARAKAEAAAEAEAGAAREAALREAVEAERGRARTLLGPYEALQQENGRLTAALAAVTHSASAEHVGTLERQVKLLVEEKAQLTSELHHAKRVQMLFQQVQSKTAELQDAADSVLSAVDQQRRQRDSARQEAPGAGRGRGRGALDGRGTGEGQVPGRGRESKFAPPQSGVSFPERVRAQARGSSGAESRATPYG